MDFITLALGLGQLVPAITKWITGSDKAAEVAEQVVSIAETVTGKTGNDALTSIKADPALLMAFKEKVMERQTELDRLAYGDIASARHMQETALQQDDIFSKRFVYYLAAWWSLFSCVYIIVISVITIPETSVRFVDTILGFLLGTVVATIIQFFLGSSIGSKTKDTLAEILAARR
jgi:hypothetical protein